MPRKLGRTTDHRMAMLRAMVTFLLENGRIETTVTRAKEVRPIAEKMVTLGKKGTLAARRQVMAFVTKEDVVAVAQSTCCDAVYFLRGLSAEEEEETE